VSAGHAGIEHARTIPEITADSIVTVTDIIVSLDAVILAVTDDTPRILQVDPEAALPRLPTGHLDPDEDDTLTMALRRLVASQTGIAVTYVEQLYTFGDRSRSDRDARDLAIGYVALTDEEATSPNASWRDVYELFPWEDHRAGAPSVIGDVIAPALADWADGDPGLEARGRITFGLGAPWDPIRVLERYELLFEAGLVSESGAVPGLGAPLARDHRRITATALGRLRGKLTYRPVIFEVMPDLFTLTHLQATVEAIVGIRLHKQNFRRIVDRGELVEATGEMTTATGGRPAELFRFRSEVVAQRPRPGFPLPRPKRM
jgi:hypothetical protein